jgi:hypothetical protein
MTEYKRVVRDKRGKIVGLEVGDPNAPSAGYGLLPERRRASLKPLGQGRHE